jgi:hypothetical protein
MLQTVYNVFHLQQEIKVHQPALVIQVIMMWISLPAYNATIVVLLVLLHQQTAYLVKVYIDKQTLLLAIALEATLMIRWTLTVRFVFLGAKRVWQHMITVLRATQTRVLWQHLLVHVYLTIILMPTDLTVRSVRHSVSIAILAT